LRTMPVDTQIDCFVSTLESLDTEEHFVDVIKIILDYTSRKDGLILTTQITPLLNKFELTRLRLFHRLGLSIGMDGRILTELVFESRDTFVPFTRELLESVGVGVVKSFVRFAGKLLEMNLEEGTTFLQRQGMFALEPFMSMKWQLIQTRLRQVLVFACWLKGVSKPITLRAYESKYFFDQLMDAFSNGSVNHVDMTAMVMETIDRLGMDPRTAVGYFSSRINVLRLTLANHYKVEAPAYCATKTLHAEPCKGDKYYPHYLVDGVTSMTLNPKNLDLFSQELLKSSFLAFTCTSPCRLIPQPAVKTEEAIQSLSIRTRRHVFHLLFTKDNPVTANGVPFIDEVLDILSRNVREQPIFAVNPAALAFLGRNVIKSKYPCLLTELFPQTRDLNGIVQVLYGSHVSLCTKASKFSTHAPPSPEAFRHQALKATIVYEAGVSKCEEVSRGKVERTVRKVTEFLNEPFTATLGDFHTGSPYYDRRDHE